MGFRSLSYGEKPWSYWFFLTRHTLRRTKFVPTSAKPNVVHAGGRSLTSAPTCAVLTQLAPTSTQSNVVGALDSEPSSSANCRLKLKEDSSMERSVARKISLFLFVISTLFTAFFMVSAIIAYPSTEAIPPIIVSIDLAAVWGLIDYHYFTCYRYLGSPESNDIQAKRKLQNRNTVLAAIMAGIAFCSLIPLLYFFAIYRVNLGLLQHIFGISAGISLL